MLLKIRYNIESAQFRLFGDGIRAMLEPKGEEKEGEKKVSSFQALMISTASRVGTGNIADVTMGFMALVNIIVILLLSKVAFKILDNYEKQRKQGKKPVFYEDEVGLTGTVWTREKEVK